jgi:hypothetical protein
MTRINGEVDRHRERRREQMGSGVAPTGDPHRYLTEIERLWDRCHALPDDDYEGRCAVLREMREAMQR